MSEETPPPIPPQAPAPPSQPQVPVSMTPRWIAWVVASVIMPALAWVPMVVPSTSSFDPGDWLLPLLLLAMVLQLAASIVLAIGFCRKRSLGVGGAIGMSIVFMIASVAIGTGVSFAVCVSGSALA